MTEELPVFYYDDTILVKSGAYQGEKGRVIYADAKWVTAMRADMSTMDVPANICSLVRRRNNANEQ